jgi:hypothetical protein
VAGWRATLSRVQKEAESPDYVEGGLAAVDGVLADVSALASTIGAPVPPELSQLKTDAGPIREKYAARAEFSGALRDFVQQLQAAKDQIAAKQWLSADQAYATAQQDLDTVGKAPAWLTPLLPAGLDPAAKRKEVEGTRAQIAGAVAGARKQQENQERLDRVARIKASLETNNRGSYETAKRQLADEAKACGHCQAASAIASASGDIDSTLKDWPIDIGSIQELKNRYADLKGRRVRIKGALTASTYYNCAFAGQSEWRSMELADGLFGSQFYVYCTRGDRGCESIFQSLAAGGSTKGSAVVKYPSYNDVCEADQALLVGWSQ